jgi:quercetin dioxygenase-like cupin family protein
MGSQSAQDWIQLASGVKRRTCAVGDRMMQVMFVYDKGAKLPEHSHVHEQLVSVISGRMRLIIAGEPHELGAGDSIALRSNIPHAAEALEDSRVIDTFSPLREDMLKQDAEAKRTI